MNQVSQTPDALSGISKTYTVIREIGSGGGGTVFLAYHNSLQKNVVLKKMKEKAKRSLDNRMEVDILKNLHHPYLPQVFDFFTTDSGDVYTVMDFIPGKSVQELLDSGVKFTRSQVAKYARQLCTAVEYLHTRKPAILHRDIKPDNIIITPDDDICLIDFNISSSEDSYVVVGLTRGYAAPEQVAAKAEYDAYRKKMRRAGVYTAPITESTETELDDFGGETAIDNTIGAETVLDNSSAVQNRVKSDFKPVNIVDARSDIFAIGATLYHMLTGVRPAADMKNNRPVEELVPDISDVLAYIINKAMEESPKKRFQSATEMLAAFTDGVKRDRRYKAMIARQTVTLLIVVAFAAVSAITAFKGYRMMQTDKGDALYNQALEMYNAGWYEDTVMFVVKDALEDTSVYDDVTLANLYYIAGSSSFRLEEYDDAITLYEASLGYVGTNAECYSNYIIALIKAGYLDRAEQAVKDAPSSGLTEDYLNLIYGEVATAKGNYSDAANYFRNCTQMTQDEYIKARAYHLWSLTYTAQPGYAGSTSLVQKNIGALEQAVSDVDSGYATILYEQLAQAYCDMNALTGDGNYALSAIGCLQALVDNGYASIEVYMNLAHIQSENGYFGPARNTYLASIDKYGENYVVYKRLAFLELSQQEATDIMARDYTQFAAYYSKALQLFSASGIQADTDSEMRLLQNSYEALRLGNWI